MSGTRVRYNFITWNSILMLHETSFQKGYWLFTSGMIIVK